MMLFFLVCVCLSMFFGIAMHKTVANQNSQSGLIACDQLLHILFNDMIVAKE